MSPSDNSPEVFLIDDDDSVCRALSRGLSSEGFSVRAWHSALEFLQEHDPQAGGCLVSDIVMPGMSGLELQSLLERRGDLLPIIFITGKGDISMSVSAMRAGAVTFLLKPVQLEVLAAAVREAMERNAYARKMRARRRAVEHRLGTLTPREREVLDLLVSGRMNKQIAAQLGTAVKTVKVHRGRVMSKMQAKSMAELLMLSSEAGIRGEWSGVWR